MYPVGVLFFLSILFIHHYEYCSATFCCCSDDAVAVRQTPPRTAGADAPQPPQDQENDSVIPVDRRSPTWGERYSSEEGSSADSQEGQERHVVVGRAGQTPWATPVSTPVDEPAGAAASASAE